MHKARPFLSCQRQREFLTQCVLSYLPLCSTGRSLEPIPPSKMTHTAKWSRCSQTNSCLSWWWELISLANLAIFQMHSSKGYSKPKIVQLQIPSGSSQTYAEPACCYQSLIQSPRAAANSRICCPEHHCDVQVGLCQWAHTRNLLFFKCTSHQKPHFH